MRQAEDGMKRRSLGLGIATLFGSVVAACSPLGTFDRLVPKDRGGTLVAKGLAYGSDPRQRLDVYAPRGGCGQTRTVVVFFYGGSWNSGTRAGYAFVGRALAAQGFVTVVSEGSYGTLVILIVPEQLQTDDARDAQRHQPQNQVDMLFHSGKCTRFGRLKSQALTLINLP